MTKVYRMPYERVMERTEKQGDCLICTCTPTRGGYAAISVNGEKRRAHRVVWAAHNGPIPKGMVIRHSCDTPACVEIDHLLIGTQADNIRDMFERGRNANLGGENNGQSKLTKEDVLAIRADPRSQRDIAKDYPVNNGTIGKIKTRSIWRHIEKGEHK